MNDFFDFEDQQDDDLIGFALMLPLPRDVDGALDYDRAGIQQGDL